MHKKAQNFNDMKFNRVCVNKQVKASVCVRVCMECNTGPWRPYVLPDVPDSPGSSGRHIII